MEGKFMGLGLKRMMGMALFTMALIVMVKVIFAKYPVAGVTDVVHSI